ncbi:MAG: BlaI/MecI/CopY family transcriptional regulator [Planctomycetota bacterium]
MAIKKSEIRPTESECNILDSVWELESATVRQVYDHLSQHQEIGYTTVLKFMQIMIRKGLLVRDVTVRPQVYRAARPKVETQQGLLRSLVDKAYRGAPGELVLQALSLKKSTPAELARIRALLDDLEKRNQK